MGPEPPASSPSWRMESKPCRSRSCAMAARKRWCECRERISKRSSDLTTRFSVLMPVHETREEWLTRAIASVRTQLYPRWELCIADDASKSPHVRRVLETAAREDPRIKVAFRERNGH